LRFRVCTGLFLSAAAVSPGAALAADWLGVDTDWANGANWSAAVPGASEAAVFGPSATTHVDSNAPAAVGSMLFTAGAPEARRPRRTRSRRPSPASSDRRGQQARGAHRRRGADSAVAQAADVRHCGTVLSGLQIDFETFRSELGGD